MKDYSEEQVDCEISLVMCLLFGITAKFVVVCSHMALCGCVKNLSCLEGGDEVKREKNGHLLCVDLVVIKGKAKMYRLLPWKVFSL